MIQTYCSIAPLLILLCAPAFGQGAGRKEICASAQTQLEMNRCWSNAAKDAEQQVSQAVASAIAKADSGENSERAKHIQLSQSKWEAYRDAECAVAGDLYIGGSMQPLAEAQCRLRLAEQRKTELSALKRESSK